MKILVVGLTYGSRPLNVLSANLDCAGYPFVYEMVNKEGIANAQNDGINMMLDYGADAVAFLSNDIEEPVNWLRKKVDALRTYPDAGIIATNFEPVTEIKHDRIIGNWLMSKETIEKIGYFCESMFPYGPIDLDYGERCEAAGIKTYYVVGEMAKHIGEHATGTEYGWDKGKLVESYWPLLHTNVEGYKQGINIYQNRLQ